MFTLKALLHGRETPSASKAGRRNVFGSQLDLGCVRKEMSKRWCPVDRSLGTSRKGFNAKMVSVWEIQDGLMVLKRHPEAAAASSAGLGGKPIPFGQETKKKVIQPLGRSQVSTKQLQRSCLHPKFPNPASKHRLMLWKRHPANATLHDPRGEGRAVKQGRKLSLGLVLN